VRERSSAEVRSTVIDDQTPFVPLVVPRVSGELTELEAFSASPWLVIRPTPLRRAVATPCRGSTMRS